MATIAQLKAALQNAQAAGDAQAVAMIQQEISRVLNEQQAAKQQATSTMAEYSPEQLRVIAQRAKEAGDQNAFNLIQNELTNRTMGEAQRTQYLQQQGSPAGAFMADMGAMLSKAVPNLRKAYNSITGDDEAKAAAQKELDDIEKFQDQLRTAFPSAVFGGEVAAPAIVGAATMPLGLGASIPAAGVEAAAFTPAGGNPIISGTVGAVAPIAGAGVVKALEKLGAPLGWTVDQIASMLRRSPEDEAARGVRKYLNDAGLNPDDVLKELDTLGKEGTLADVEGMRGVTQYAAMTPAGRQFQGAFEARQMGQSDRIMNTISRMLGKENATEKELFKGFLQERAANAEPLYQEAFDLPFSTAMEGAGELFLPLIERSRGMGAFSQAKKLAKTEGFEFNPEDMGMRELHYIKRGLDDAINSSMIAGKKDASRALTGLKNELLEQMDAVNPAYAKARQQYAGDSAVINAMELGRDLFRPKVDGRLIDIEDMSAIVAGYSDSERRAFQQSAIKAVQEKLAKVPDTADNARRLWNRPDIRGALEVAFPDPGNFQQFIGMLKKESAFTDTLRELYQGSQTELRRQAAQAFKVTGADAHGKTITDLAINAFKQELSPEGQQALAKMMFDPEVTTDQIKQMMVKSGIIPNSTPTRLVAKIREEWPTIKRQLTDLNTPRAFSYSGTGANPGLTYLGLQPEPGTE